VQAAALAEAVTRIAWLAPSAEALAHLARSGSAADWAALRHDPGCVALILRAAPAAITPKLFSNAALRDPAVMNLALEHLDQPAYLDLASPAVRTVYEAAIDYADRSARLAALSRRADPETAWAIGLLAPLGWLAVAAVAADVVTECLSKPDDQRRLWGHEQSAMARRLARRWSLPTWASAILGHLGLPVTAAQALGADPGLLLIVQLAIGLAERQQPRLGLEIGTTPAECIAGLGLPASALELPAATASLPQKVGHAPQGVPLLRDLIQVAAENRRLAGAALVDQLEHDVDELHAALCQQYVSEPERLRTLQLGTLAEFAAGAGHEINNPLAVISGQAQYLLGHEEEPGRQMALRKIVGQAQRIHEILTELMQFARPSRPQKRPVELAVVIRDVVAALGDLAEQRKVRLVCPEPETPARVLIDARQIRVALTCLLRNAIEAAPVEGWAGIRLTLPTVDRVELVVEDSGPGPGPAQREHMFDPFYSGRQAGRGRGLGLPTAWRLAREHGGEVFWDERSEGPTRFVLRLPRDPALVDVPEPITMPGLIAS
jgi:signal transduction histidine kinase